MCFWDSGSGKQGPVCCSVLGVLSWSGNLLPQVQLAKSKAWDYKIGRILLAVSNTAKKPCGDLRGRQWRPSEWEWWTPSPQGFWAGVSTLQSLGGSDSVTATEENISAQRWGLGLSNWLVWCPKTAHITNSKWCIIFSKKIYHGIWDSFPFV